MFSFPCCVPAAKRSASLPLCCRARRTRVRERLGLSGRIRAPTEVASPCSARVPSSLGSVEEAAQGLLPPRSPLGEPTPDVGQQPRVAIPLPCAGWRQLLLKLLDSSLSADLPLTWLSSGLCSLLCFELNQCLLDV